MSGRGHHYTTSQHIYAEDIETEGIPIQPDCVMVGQSTARAKNASIVLAPGTTLFPSLSLKSKILKRVGPTKSEVGQWKNT